MAERLLVKPQGNPVGYDKDLVEQINKCLRARDQVLDQLLAEPVCFAFACGTTTGTGGITALYTYGCSLEVDGTQVVARFQDERPNDRYVYDGLIVRDAAFFPTSVALTTKTTRSCGLRFKNDSGNTVSASSVSFTSLIWALGPRK